MCGVILQDGVDGAGPPALPGAARPGPARTAAQDRVQHRLPQAGAQYGPEQGRGTQQLSVRSRLMLTCWVLEHWGGVWGCACRWLGVFADMHACVPFVSVCVCVPVCVLVGLSLPVCLHSCRCSYVDRCMEEDLCKLKVKVGLIISLRSQSNMRIVILTWNKNE